MNLAIPYHPLTCFRAVVNGFVLTLCALSYLSPCAQAVPKAPASSGILKVPAYEVARQELFEHIQRQPNVALTLLDFPTENLLSWVDTRHTEVPLEFGSRYQMVGEHLLIAQQLLKSADPATCKRGYHIASETANFAASKLKGDKWLLARIYEGFLLPNIALANVQLWQDPSRSRIIEAAVSAFEQAKERDKEIHTLEWLLSIGEKTSEQNSNNRSSIHLEQNTLDWARGALAEVLSSPLDAKREELRRSLILLQAIQSPEMTGYKHIQVRVQSRLDHLDGLHR